MVNNIFTSVKFYFLSAAALRFFLKPRNISPVYSSISKMLENISVSLVFSRLKMKNPVHFIQFLISKRSYLVQVLHVIGFHSEVAALLFNFNVT